MCFFGGLCVLLGRAVGGLGAVGIATGGVAVVLCGVGRTDAVGGTGPIELGAAGAGVVATTTGTGVVTAGAGAALERGAVVEGRNRPRSSALRSVRTFADSARMLRSVASGSVPAAAAAAASASRVVAAVWAADRS